MGVIREIFANFTDPLSGDTAPVYKYKLFAHGGVEVHLLSYGAGICTVLAPDSRGVKEHVVLGFDSMEGYLANPYQGSTIGRCSNRIKGGTFSMGGQIHQLTVNNNGNHLHGGTRGWAMRLWSSSVAGDAVVFSLVSSDGDQGYPGTVMAQVRYTLSAPGRLQVDYTALTSAPTPVNMTNHAYFNLAGHGSGRAGLVQHTVQLECDRYMPVTEDLIPTGEQRLVKDTAFDLRTEHSVADVIDAVEGGFDHCFVLADQTRGTMRRAATFTHPPSGRRLEVLTTEPGVQFYTSNFLPSEGGKMVGRSGVSYLKHGAFCCEGQNLPDAVNQKSFPDSILTPGEVYRHSLLYSFTVV